MSQQAFPRPPVQHLLAANQAVRRCRQQRDLEMRVPFIPPYQLTICFWSDAAFANGEDHKTQGGWLMSLTSKDISQGTDVQFTVLVGNHTSSHELFRPPFQVMPRLLRQPPE
jgi:hypothetical protein